MADSLRDRAARGAARLKKLGEYDEASAIEAFLAPGGWVDLRDTDTRELSPLNLTMTTDLKEVLREAAREFGMPLPALAEEGYRAVLETGWRPPRTVRRKSGGTRAILPLSVDAGLRRQVQPKLQQLSAEAGYRVTESSIVLSWMCDELGVQRGEGPSMSLVLPRPLRDHFVAAAETAGVSLDAVVEERVQALVDGSCELPRPSRSPKGSQQGVERTKLAVRVREDLQDALAELAPRLSESLGMRLYPGMIVRWILIDRLGQPAE